MSCNADDSSNEQTCWFFINVKQVPHPLLFSTESLKQILSFFYRAGARHFCVTSIDTSNELIIAFFGNYEYADYPSQKDRFRIFELLQILMTLKMHDICTNCVDDKYQVYPKLIYRFVQFSSDENSFFFKNPGDLKINDSFINLLKEKDITWFNIHLPEQVYKQKWNVNAVSDITYTDPNMLIPIWPLQSNYSYRNISDSDCTTVMIGDCGVRTCINNISSPDHLLLKAVMKFHNRQWWRYFGSVCMSLILLIYVSFIHNHVYVWDETKHNGMAIFYFTISVLGSTIYFCGLVINFLPKWLDYKGIEWEKYMCMYNCGRTRHDHDHDGISSGYVSDRDVDEDIDEPEMLQNPFIFSQFVKQIDYLAISCYICSAVCFIYFVLFDWVLEIPLWIYVLIMLMYLIDSIGKPLGLFEHFLFENIILQFDDKTVKKDPYLCFVINKLNLELFQFLMDGYKRTGSDNDNINTATPHWERMDQYFLLRKFLRKQNGDPIGHRGIKAKKKTKLGRHVELRCKKKDDNDTNGDTNGDTKESHKRVYWDFDTQHTHQQYYFDVYAFWNCIQRTASDDVDYDFDYYQAITKLLVNFHIKQNTRYYTKLCSSDDVIFCVVIMFAAILFGIFMMPFMFNQILDFAFTNSVLAWITGLLAFMGHTSELFELLIRFRRKSTYIHRDLTKAIAIKMGTNWYSCEYQTCRWSYDEDSTSIKNIDHENIVKCLLFKHFKNMNFIVNRYMDGEFKYNQISNLTNQIEEILLHDVDVQQGTQNYTTFPYDLSEIIFLYAFGPKMICVDQLLRIAKSDFLRYEYVLMFDRIMKPVTTFSVPATKSWSKLIHNLKKTEN